MVLSIYCFKSDRTGTRSTREKKLSDDGGLYTKNSESKNRILEILVESECIHISAKLALQIEVITNFLAIDHQIWCVGYFVDSFGYINVKELELQFRCFKLCQPIMDLTVLVTAKKAEGKHLLD